jgi:O-antigen ligase
LHIAISRTNTVAGVDDFAASVTRQILIFLVTIKIAGILLVVDPAGFQAFDLPKSLFSHAMAWPIAVTLFAAVLRFGPGILPRTRLHVAVAGFALVNLVSALLAENPYVAVFGDQDRYLGLAFVADMVLLYLATTVGFRSANDFAAALASVATAAGFVLVYAGVQAAGLDPLRWVHDPRDRPFATLGHPDILGHFLSVAFALGLGVASSVPPNARHLRAVAIAAAVVCVGLAGVVAVRGTLLGIAAALVALIAVALRRRGQSVILRSIVVAVMAVALLGGVMAITPLGERTTQAIADAGTGRLALYDAAIRAMLDRPILGYGPDSFGVAYPSYRQPPPYGGVDPQTSAHNWVLQAAVTTGLAGLASFLVLLISFGIAVWRAIPRAPTLATPIVLALAAYFANGLVSVGSISVDWLPWFCFGSIAAITGESRPSAARKVPSLILPLLALLAIAGFLAPRDALQANRDASLARSEWTAGQTVSAITAAEAAVGRDPGRAEYWNWLGLARDQAGLWRDSASAYQEAVMRAAHEAVYWDNLALARGAEALEDGNVEAGKEAVAAALRAVEVDPYANRVNSTLSDIAYQFGDFDLAFRGSLRTTLLYDPSYGHRTFLSSQKLSDLRSARRLLEDAVAVRDVFWLRLALAEIAFRMNDRVYAEINARRALELTPGDPDALALLAQVLR